MLKKIYLAIPYTGIEQSSYIQSLNTTAFLMEMNKGEMNVFSPILHSHPLTNLGLKGNWDFWKEIDYQFIDWCDEVYVLIPKEGGELIYSSVGVQAELKYAKEKGKKITYILAVNDNKYKEIEMREEKMNDI